MSLSIDDLLKLQGHKTTGTTTNTVVIQIKEGSKEIIVIKR